MTEEQKTFTKEDAKAMSILDVASSLGMEFERKSPTSYKWTEHDSFVIDTRINLWNWFSKEGKSGDVINLVQEIKGVSFKEAMHYLKTGEFPIVSIKEEKKEPFRYVLASYEQPFKEARTYLKEERRLSDETIDFFLEQGVLAQAMKKAQDGYLEPVVVFKFLDQNKKVVGATLQGITQNQGRYEGRGYLKQILYNSDGLNGMSVDIGVPKRLIFAEAPIDLMSYYELNRGVLSDVRLVSMDGLKSGIIARHTMQLLAELEGVKDYQFDPQKVNTVLKGFQTISFFKEEENQNFITLAVDNDKAGREFLSNLKERGVPVQSALPPLKEGQEKTDWNDVLKETKKELKFEKASKNNSRLAQARRKLDRLKGEASGAIDNVYKHTSLANGQPMNDKRGGASYFRRQEQLENRVVTKLDEIKKQEERVEKLEWQKGLKEQGFNRSGNGLALTVDNIPRIREEIEKYDNGQSFFTRATIKKYREKLVELEALQKQLEGIIVSAGAQHLIDEGLVTQWQKHPTTFFVKGLRKVAFELGEDGYFQLSPKYVPQTEAEKAKVNNLLLIQSTQTRIDELISDIALTGEGFYLWHDYELEELGVSEEIVQEFHNRLEDIQYEKDGIHLYVEESVNDEATGYLSLEGNVLDSEGIRDYLEDSELSSTEQIIFLTNLETAVEQTWNKVVEHYNQVFDEIVLKYGLRQSEEKQEELAMKQEDVPTIEMATEASRQSSDTVRSEIDDNLTFKVEPVKSVVIGAEEIEELVSKTDNDATEKTELLSEERQPEAIPTPKYLLRINIDGVELVNDSSHFSTVDEAHDWLLTHFMNQIDRRERYFKTDITLTFVSKDGELEEFKDRLDIGLGSGSFTPNHQHLSTYLNKSYAGYFEERGFILETAEEVEQKRVQELFQHPIFRDSTDTIDYLLENYVTSQELEMLISYFEHESELPISLTQVQYALTEVEATLNIDAFVNSFEEKNEYLDRNIEAFKNRWPNYQDTPAEEIYQIYKSFQHPVFRNYSATTNYLLSHSVSSQELEALIARFGHEQKLPIPLFTAVDALKEERKEQGQEKTTSITPQQRENMIGFFEQNIDRFRHKSGMDDLTEPWVELYFEHYYVGRFGLQHGYISEADEVKEAIDKIELTNAGHFTDVWDLTSEALESDLGYDPNQVYQRLYLGKVSIKTGDKEYSSFDDFKSHVLNKLETQEMKDYLADDYYAIKMSLEDTDRAPDTFMIDSMKWKIENIKFVGDFEVKHLDELKQVLNRDGSLNREKAEAIVSERQLQEQADIELTEEKVPAISQETDQGVRVITAEQRENIIGFFEQNIDRFRHKPGMDDLTEPWTELYFESYYAGRFGLEHGFIFNADEVSKAIDKIELTNAGHRTDVWDLTLEVLETKLGYDPTQVYPRIHLGEVSIKTNDNKEYSSFDDFKLDVLRKLNTQEMKDYLADDYYDIKISLEDTELAPDFFMIGSMNWNVETIKFVNDFEVKHPDELKQVLNRDGSLNREKAEAIVSERQLQEQADIELGEEKALEVSQGQEKNAEGTIGDFPGYQEAAPLPEANQSQPLNDLSPSQTQPQPYLHFTIREDGKSIDKRYYHPASLKDIAKLNRYAPNIQQTAKWYLDTVADSRIIYLYQDGENVSSLAVQFDRDKFMHLTGIFPYREGQTAEQTLLDFANGKGDYDSILIANKGATFDKIKVLPELEAITESDSFYFGDLSEVPKLHQLNLDKAIRSGDEDVVLAMRTVDGTPFPASLMKVRQSLKLQLDHSNEAKTILGVYRDRDGVIDQLSINEELVKDGGKAMLSILINKQYEEMVERIDDKELEQRLVKETDKTLLKEAFAQRRDVDGDGVSDEVERSLGTDPYDVTSAPHHRMNQEEIQLTEAELFTSVLDSVVNVGVQVFETAQVSDEVRPMLDLFQELNNQFDGQFHLVVAEGLGRGLVSPESDFFKEWVDDQLEEQYQVGRTDVLNGKISPETYHQFTQSYLNHIEQERQGFLSQKSSQNALSDILNEKDTKALSAHLKEGMKEYAKSDQYKNFLTAMSKFHDYSVKNIQLMLAQNKDITHVASYQTWKKEFGRQVQKGEKGIKIFVPVQVKVRDENGEVKRDENGKEMTVTRFTFGTVFDVKQTEGKELPKPIHLLEGSVPDYENLYRATRQASLDNHVPISFKAIEGDANGYYNLETREIVIAEKQMSEAQIMKTLFHEMAHSRLHHQADGFTTVERELQAESIAYVVASHYGIDTSDYSFAYLHSWSQDQQNYSDLEAQLKVIQSESKRMMEKIDVRLEEVKTKSKFADKLQSKLEKAEAETKKAIEQKRAEEKTQVAKKSPVPQKEH